MPQGRFWERGSGRASERSRQGCRLPRHPSSDPTSSGHLLPQAGEGRALPAPPANGAACWPPSPAASCPAGRPARPSRGRTDVLPTGRNLYGTDPRAVPSRTAFDGGRRAADAVAERYAQDHGDWPRTIVLDLWASATMRTAGEDFRRPSRISACARPGTRRPPASSGFEILPFASLERPRVDVTLRISGLFRDVFPAQIALFDQAVQAIAALDEEDEINPLAAARRAGVRYATRVRHRAAALRHRAHRGARRRPAGRARLTLGRAYLAAASHAYGGAKPPRRRRATASRRGSRRRTPSCTCERPARRGHARRRRQRRGRGRLRRRGRGAGTDARPVPSGCRRRRARDFAHAGRGDRPDRARARCQPALDRRPDAPRPSRCRRDRRDDRQHLSPWP